MMAIPTKSMRRLSETQVRFKPVVVIVGPTAVGKSRIAVEVAKAFETEVLTADSRQVYRGMDVGTDKPAPEERQGIPHRLIDLVGPDESFNAGLYRRQAIDEIERLYRDHRLPLVVGGTGLYVRTLLKGLCDAPPTDPIVRAALKQEAEDQGHDRLYARLVEVDPVAASRLHPRDESKVLRALEVYQLSGRRMSEFQQEHGFAERPFSTLMIGLNRDRDALYRRIEERIDWQLAHGLIEETKQLLDQGYQRDSAAMKGLGYRQVAEHLAGVCDSAEMVRRFKRDTRRFSKRQMTWFRKEPGIQWLTIEESESVQHTTARVIGQADRFLTTLF
ncbi:MAG TPA: tRNA (adenosine(37)-N6)-dimethylallyltransferase MiaA [Nitrospiraceae bacterium]|nr:tRNA (adenosine(37)-N6)-dimethylallyltransferase MiaA [Nitrospiraceae bacterium]